MKLFIIGAIHQGFKGTCLQRSPGTAKQPGHPLITGDVEVASEFPWITGLEKADGFDLHIPPDRHFQRPPCVPPVITPADAFSGELKTVAGTAEVGIRFSRLVSGRKTVRRRRSIISRLRPAEPDLARAGKDVVSIDADIIVKTEKRSALTVVVNLLASHRRQRCGFQWPLIIDIFGLLPLSAFALDRFPVECLVSQNVRITAPIGLAVRKTAPHAKLILPVVRKYATFILNE